MLRYLAVIVGILSIGLANIAQAQSYAQHSNDIRAAVLLLDSAVNGAGQPINFTPFAWYNLDADAGVKPPGMNIFNPAAATQVTGAIQTRWNLAPAAFGNSMGKSTAGYWELRLSQASDIQLSNYDVLLLSAYGFTSLSSIEREKLRKFVDQGGVLWIDVNSASNFTNATVDTFPLPLQTLVTGPALLTNADAFAPLTTTPYILSLTSLEQIRSDRTSFATPLPQVAPLSWDIESWLDTDYSMHFNSIAGSGVNPTVLEGRLGDGYVVVTSSAYAATLNRVPTGAGTYNANSGFYAVPPVYDRTTQLAAKFAMNVIALSSTYSQPGGGARKTNSIPQDLLPPLLSNERINDAGVQQNQTPVLYKGLLVVASGNKLKVYNAHPGTSLDGSTNFDGGIQDFSLGAGYDELWESQPMGATISAPTCAEIPGANVKDQIFVVDDQGILYAYSAFDLVGGTINPSRSTTVAPIYTVNPPQTCQFDTSKWWTGPYAPTFHDGLLYISSVATTPSSTGMVWIADPLSQGELKTLGSGNPWYVGSNNATTLPIPSGSPTVGDIPIQDNSGGYDRVMYLPGRPSSVMGPTGTASVTSLWLGTRGESPPPSSITYSAGDVTITTRAARQGLPIYLEGAGTNQLANRSLGVKLTVLHANTGIPFTNSEMTQYFTGLYSQAPSAIPGLGNGVLTFFTTSDISQIPGGVNIRLDYSINWEQVANLSGANTTLIIRGQLYVPDDYVDYVGDDRRRIVGNIAMSPRGTIYFVTSTQLIGPAFTHQDCGSFYAVREDIGRGGFRLLTRYQLYPRHNVPINRIASGTDEPGEVNYEQTFEDSDGLLSLPGTGILAGKDFSQLTFIGTPSVRGNIVYVTAMGLKPPVGGIRPPFGLLLAFKAEPETPTIRVGNIQDGFSLRQFDIDRSFNHNAPNSTNDMAQGQFTYDRNEGLIRFDNLMTTNRGVMVNAFSTSQPVVLRRTNMPDQLIDPDSTNAKWTPLLWYTVLHGVQVQGSAFTSGNSVFVPCRSVIPNLAALIATGIPTFSGMIYAYNGVIAPDDPFLQTYPDKSRQWMHQLWQIGPSFPGPVGPTGANPDILWPQLVGVTGLQDYVIRARQTTLGSADACFGVVGGEGSLAAWGTDPAASPANGGVTLFQKADIFVADEGRLGRYDAVGNPLWISSATSNTGYIDQGSVGSIKQLVRPVRSYPGVGNDIAVADPGGNRVARIDLSGNELRSITSFKVDPLNVPDGFVASESTSLNAPRDVAFFRTYSAVELDNHYLIADSGNKRILEVVDRFSIDVNRNVTGTIDTGVLVWHSPANFTGKDFEYNTIARIYEPVSQRYYYLAAIGGAAPARIDSGLDSNPGGTVQTTRESTNGNGGIVIFDPLDPSKNVIVNQVVVPDVPVNALWNFQTGSFNSLDRPSHTHTLTNVNSVTASIQLDSSANLPRVALMITDSTGVYEAWLQNPTNDPSQPWYVDWMLPNEVYRALRRQGNNPPAGSSALDLRATYARRLSDGDVMVVNGYFGTTLGGAEFKGEVLQINGGFDAAPTLVSEGFNLNKPNLGFDLGMIAFQLPPIQGARGLVLPVFADRR